MSRIDPEKEHRRLADFYAGQMDGELEQVAGQAYELTELAREALRAEVARRGLTPAFVEHVPEIVKEDSGRSPVILLLLSFRQRISCRWRESRNCER